MKPMMVFDVESLGLHGEGFAFGYVVLDGKTGSTVEEGIYSCPISEARFHVAGMSATWFPTCPPRPTRPRFSFARSFGGSGGGGASNRGFPHQSPRLPAELPVHNPLADARQSARLLWEYLHK